MRTRYFREASLSEEGKNNVKALAALSDNSTNRILDWLESRESYPRGDAHERAELASATGESGDVILSTVSVLLLFIDRIVHRSDSIDAFYSDLKELNLVDAETGYRSLDIIFRRLPSIIEKYRFLRRRRIAESAGLPTLTGSTMTAAIKPVFAKEFEYGEDAIEQYRPSPMGFTAVAILELQKGDTNEVFAFQVNRDNFNRFITDLLALQAEMNIMEDYIRNITHGLAKG